MYDKDFVLRDVRDEREDGQPYCGLEERVKDMMESLKQKGFLNYLECNDLEHPLYQLIISAGNQSTMSL